MFVIFLWLMCEFISWKLNTTTPLLRHLRWPFTFLTFGNLMAISSELSYNFHLARDINGSRMRLNWRGRQWWRWRCCCCCLWQIILATTKTSTNHPPDLPKIVEFFLRQPTIRMVYFRNETNTKIIIVGQERYIDKS